jgi:hypothetical protein
MGFQHCVRALHADTVQLPSPRFRSPQYNTRMRVRHESMSEYIKYLYIHVRFEVNRTPQYVYDALYTDVGYILYITRALKKK